MAAPRSHHHDAAAELSRAGHDYGSHVVAADDVHGNANSAIRRGCAECFEIAASVLVKRADRTVGVEVISLVADSIIVVELNHGQKMKLEVALDRDVDRGMECASRRCRAVERAQDALDRIRGGRAGARNEHRSCAATEHAFGAAAEQDVSRAPSAVGPDHDARRVPGIGFFEDLVDGSPDAQRRLHFAAPRARGRNSRREGFAARGRFRLHGAGITLEHRHDADGTPLGARHLQRKPHGGLGRTRTVDGNQRARKDVHATIVRHACDGHVNRFAQLLRMSFTSPCDGEHVTRTPPDAIRVRMAQPGDEERIAAMARTLSQDSICRRFMAFITRDAAAAELRRETRCTGREVALVAEDADGAIVGQAYAAPLDDDSAEAAFIVSDRSQHHGVGGLLFAGVVRELAAQGVRTMRIEMLAENLNMLRLVEDSKLTFTRQRIDGTIELLIQLPQAGADSGLAS